MLLTGFVLCCASPLQCILDAGLKRTSTGSKVRLQWDMGFHFKVAMGVAQGSGDHLHRRQGGRVAVQQRGSPHPMH